MQKNNHTFLASVFFVLGFSTVFSLLGVLLQTVLSSIGYEVQLWLGRVGGALIIFFGIYLMGFLKIPFLDRDYKITVKHKFKSMYLTSFVFGAAFAVGWTPCVGAVLGAILTLAVAQPSMAFFLLLSYSLGLGIPFLLTGLFVNQAQSAIKKMGKTLNILKYIFGAILIVIGIFVFVNQLGRLANFAFIANFLTGIDASFSSGSVNIGVAFIAGLVSFLSPCVLPLIPAFLSYLASTVVKPDES